MNEAFVPAFLNSFFISLGVLLGGSIIGGLAAFFTGQAPMTTVFRLSDSLRIWAIVAAIGGLLIWSIISNAVFSTGKRRI